MGRPVVGLATGDSEEAVSCPPPGMKETAAEKADSDCKQTDRFFPVMICEIKIK